MARHGNLTPDMLRDTVIRTYPVPVPLYDGDMKPTPFIGIRNSQGGYGANPVSPTFVHFTPEQMGDIMADILTLAYPKGYADLRETGGGIRVEFYPGTETDPTRYGVHILMVAEPNVRPIGGHAGVLRVACYNGMIAPYTLASGTVRNSTLTFETKVSKLVDSLTIEAERAARWSTWVETLGGHNLTDTEARVLLGRILGLPNPTMGQFTPAQERKLQAYMGAYHAAPGAQPGTLRGILESVTYVGSHAQVRDRPGALVPHSETEKREDASLPGTGSEYRTVYSSLVREIEAMGHDITGVITR